MISSFAMGLPDNLCLCHLCQARGSSTAEDSLEDRELKSFGQSA